jgi:hypothetical protein
MRHRNLTILHHAQELLALLIVELWALSRRLVVYQSGRGRRR